MKLIDCFVVIGATDHQIACTLHAELLEYETPTPITPQILECYPTLEDRLPDDLHIFALS